MNDFLKFLMWSTVFLFCIILSSNAYAFKADTHVWVGQQVLNDVLDDGKITIKIDGIPFEYVVRQELLDAIRSNPSIFRMGNVGPDAFPDILTGQMVVHPGAVNGWQTDDWLKWIANEAENNPKALAFAAGYLGHAATDIFSHTYVNQYSGDAFSLTDGELDVEVRHYALEDFIVQKTPPLTDSNGTLLGEPSTLLQTPAKYIKDRLILNDTVSEQYQKAGGGAHLSAVHELHETLGTLYDPLSELEIVVTQLIVYYIFEYDLNKEEAQFIIDASQEMNTVLHDISGYDQIQSVKNEFTDFLIDHGRLDMALNEQIDSATMEVIRLSQKYDESVLDVLEAQEALDEVAVEICEEFCDWVAVKICDSMPWPYDDICNWDNQWKCNLTCRPNPLHQQFADEVRVRLDIKHAIEQELVKAKDDLIVLKNKATQIAIEAIEAENEIFNALVDYAQRMTEPLNGLRAHVDSWRLDIQDGMEAYAFTNGEVIKNVIKGENPLDPLIEWKDCWGYAVIGGVPSPLTQGGCQIVNRIEKIQDLMGEMEEIMAKLNPAMKEWMKLKENITDKIEAKVEDVALKLAEDVTGIEVELILELLKTPTDAETLNLIYSNDASGKNLLYIDDIAQRVEAEMYLTEDGYFDPEQYAVAYNSVVFAKMALLTSAQMNQLAFVNARVTYPTIYGNTLYPEQSDQISFSLLFDAVRSIDGNHQWMETAPPYPRRDNYIDETWWDADIGEWTDVLRYGYGFEEGKKGLRIWLDPDAHGKVFLKIFKGPLVPALETPYETFDVLGYNFNDVLPKGYLYDVCEANPYPWSIYDNSCPPPNSNAKLPAPALNAVRGANSNRGNWMGRGNNKNP